MTIVEAMAERAARGELTLTEMQEAVATLLRDLACRQGPDGSVKVIEDIVVGDWVIAFGFLGQNKGPVRVLAVHDNGVRDCRTYGFSITEHDTQTGKRLYSTVATLCATKE